MDTLEARPTLGTNQSLFAAGRRMPGLRLLKVAGLLALHLGAAGCATFNPVETTPEGILAVVKPGDTVKIRTREQQEMTLFVWSVSQVDISGSRDGGKSDALERVRYDRIESIDVKQLNLKKAMLTTFVPVIVGAIIFCNNEDCDTHSAVTAGF